MNEKRERKKDITVDEALKVIVEEVNKLIENVNELTGAVNELETRINKIRNFLHLKFLDDILDF